MAKRIKILLTAAVVMLCLTSLTPAAQQAENNKTPQTPEQQKQQANQTQPEIKIVYDPNTTVWWTIGFYSLRGGISRPKPFEIVGNVKRKTVIANGPIKPKYAAELFLAYESSWYISQKRGERDLIYTNADQYKLAQAILSAEAGKELSDKQRELLYTNDCIVPLERFGEIISNHYCIRLYAVSREDAENLGKAFVQYLTNRNKENLERAPEWKKEVETNIDKLQQEIKEHEQKLRELNARHKELKDKRHFLSTDEATQLIARLNEMLAQKTIEIAGLEAELEVLRESSGAYSHAQDFRKTFLGSKGKLSKIKAEHRKASEIRTEAEEFVTTVEQKEQTNSKLSQLHKDLPQANRRLIYAKRTLVSPTPRMRPPKLYQNKITIYPVKEYKPEQDD